jgi:hypothetical protein
MSNPSVAQVDKITEPKLSDLLDLHKKDIFLSFNCHAIATIQSFDATKQTCTATINYKRTYSQKAPDGSYRPVLVDYPLLLDVPVVVMSGGPARITFPVTKGDTCLILFNDRDIDNWFQSGQIGPVASGRLHSIADGIALVGIRPASNPHADYDETHAGISWGETLMMVNEEKILLRNAVETLNDILQDLMTQLQTLTVAGVTPGGGVSGVPVNAAALAAIATRIGGLLE